MSEKFCLALSPIFTGRKMMPNKFSPDTFDAAMKHIDRLHAVLHEVRKFVAWPATAAAEKKTLALIDDALASKTSIPTLKQSHDTDTIEPKAPPKTPQHYVLSEDLRDVTDEYT